MKTKDEIKTIITGIMNYYYTYSRNDENGLKYVEKLIEDMNKYKPEFLEHMLIQVYEDIETEKLFSENIVDTISYLMELKNSGYNCIAQEWSGYETNYFVAGKKRYEEDREFFKRLIEEIDPLISDLVRKEKLKKDKEKRIKELEKQLKVLKSQ